MGKTYNIDQLCERLNVTKATVSAWYRFKKENPDNELAKLLPECYRSGPRKARIWTAEMIPYLLEFQTKMPKGCRGVMGSVTQKYVKKKGKD